VAQPPAFACDLEPPPFDAGHGQPAMAAWAGRQDEPPPGSRVPRIAPAGGKGEHDGGLAAAEKAGWHGLSPACGRLPTEGYLTSYGIRL